MRTYNLPDDLLEGSSANAEEVIIRCYTSEHDSIKNKLVLSYNMINLLVSGTKTIVYPESTAVVNAGELVILSAGNVLTSELLTDSQPFRSVLFYFSNEVFNRFLIKYAHLLNTAVPKCGKKSFHIFKQDTFIRQFIISVQALVKLGDDLPAEVRLLKIEELLLYLLHADPGLFNSIQIITDDKEQLQIKKVVESHIGQPITVDELAFLCHMSLSTFKRKFSELYKTTPQKWLSSRRMEMAAELLTSPGESPSMIYMQVGYQNHSSFTEAFRNHFGCTPSEYRQAQLNG